MSSNHRLGCYIDSILFRKNLITEDSLGKRLKCFPSTLRWRNFNWKATITDHYGFVFEENSDRKVTWLSNSHRFRKASFSKCFQSTLKRKEAFSNFYGLKSVFEKLRFGDGLVWTVGLIRRRDKTACSNFSTRMEFSSILTDARFEELITVFLPVFVFLAAEFSWYKPCRHKQKCFNYKIFILQQFCC